MTRTLLCIDRDPSVRLLLQKGLATAGFRVLGAEDAARGGDLARDTQPDAVLVDLDGLEVSPADLVATLRRTPGLERAALLGATAEDRPERLQRAESCGFAAVLVKPLDLDLLAARLEPHGARRVTAKTDGTAPAPLAAAQTLTLRTLGPLLESLVATVSAADAVLVLGSGEDPEVVVAAAYSVRPGARLPVVGARVTLDAVPWLREAMGGPQPLILDASQVQASALLAAEITSLLVVPLADEACRHGAVVLGERRRRTYAFPPAQVEETVREAARITFALQQLARLRASLAEARRDVERFRAQMTRRVAAGGTTEGASRHEAVLELGLQVARTLGLDDEETELIRLHAQVHDAGLTWLRQALLPHLRVSPEIRDRLLELRADLDAEILDGLGWSEPHRLPSAGNEPELAAEVVRAVVGYRDRLAGTAGAPGDRATAIAALRQGAITPAARRAVDALATALAATSP